LENRSNEKNKDEGTIPAWVSAVLAVFLWAEAIFFTIFFFLFNLIFVFPLSVVLEPGRRGFVHHVAHWWGKMIVAVIPMWRITMKGQENIEPNKPYVVVANHQSLLDILVVLAALPIHFKFLAKQELFRIPMFGWHMKLAGYIPLVRSNRESGRAAVGLAEDWLKKGVSVLFFPEGTRSLDGNIKEFKVGAFRIARNLGVDILPVVLDGTGQALPKKSWRLMKKSNFSLQIEKPISAKELKGDLDKVREDIRQRMIHRLAGIRSER